MIPAKSSLGNLLLLATGCFLFVHVQSNQEFQCGKNKVSSSRINGQEVLQHSIPWQVAIFKHPMVVGGEYVFGHRNSDNKAQCGGTLISSRHVLTAAHCVHRFSYACERYSVGVGMHKDNVTDGTRLKIKHISVHPNWTRIGCNDNFYVSNFDFAILHLASPVHLKNKVIPACLPDESLGGDFLAGKDVTVSGWGWHSDGVLKKASYPARMHEECKKYNNEDGCDVVTANMLCAGNLHNSTANHHYGDSGGPLTYNNHGRETVVGVVSWSRLCGKNFCDGTFGVYARVTEQLKWIKKEMETPYDICPVWGCYKSDC